MSSRRATTYRVRQIPAWIDRSRLPRFLAQILDYDGDVQGIRVYSLATSLPLYEDISIQEATVMFDHVPAVLTTHRQEWLFPAVNHNLQHNLLIDTHFLGFTVFNDVHTTEHEYDCIAISGLASHAFGSWRCRDDNSTFMWLRDYLPHLLKGTRSIIYGYDTKLVNSQSFQTLHDLAVSFISKLRSAEFSTPSSRPIIFIAHSLGGVVIQRAVTLLASSGTAESSILSKIDRVFLFAVPHTGMAIDHLLAMVDTQPNKALIELLREGSPLLLEFSQQFNRICYAHDIRLMSAFETRMTNIPVRHDTGQWRRTGQPQILVRPPSARHTGSDLSIPIDRDHSSIVKFSEGDPDLSTVLRHLRETKGSRASGRVSQSVAESVSYTLRSRSTYPTPASTAASEVDQILQNLMDQTAKRMLSSLRKHSSSQRYHEIAVSHERTLAWIYDKDELRLRDWLDHGTGVYWITGKPGSGKSTAMKYICRNLPPTFDDPGSAELIVKFFFFHSGSHFQKSFEGLLTSILFQICSQSRWALYKLLLHYFVLEEAQADWTIDHLESGFRSIVLGYLEATSPALPSIARAYFARTKVVHYAQVLDKMDTILNQIQGSHPPPRRITIFLDALDEYDGAPQRIIQFVQGAVRTQTSPHIQCRICCSSRPWNAFNDALTGHLGFAVDEHTTADLCTYVADTFNHCPSTKAMMVSTNTHIRSTIHDLQRTILARADGVFLWVTLVLQNLLQAAADGATARELSRIMAELPAELTELYSLLLHRTDPVHRRETYYMLEVLVRVSLSMNTTLFWQIFRCAACHTWEECQLARRDAQRETDESNEMILRRIRSRCGGLIEVDRHDLTVRFMHQTVAEYVTSPGFQRTLMSPEGEFTSANGNSVVLRWELGFEQGDSDTYGRFAQKAELTTGRTERELWESVPDSFFWGHTLGWRQESHLYVIAESANELLFDRRLTFACAANLRLYMADYLDNHVLSPLDGGRLLHFVMEPLVRGILTKEHRTSYVSRLPLLQLLLRKNARIDVRNHGLDPFQRLHACLRPAHYALRDIPWYLDEVVAMLEVLVDYGASPQAEVYWDYHPVSKIRRSTKAIHVASSKSLLQKYISAGVDVNCLDGEGRTPIDCLLTHALVKRPKGEALALDKRANSKYACGALRDCVALLLDHGGRCTTNSPQRVLLAFNERMVDVGLPKIDEILSLPPEDVAWKQQQELTKHPSVVVPVAAHMGISEVVAEVSDSASESVSGSEDEGDQ